MIIRVALFGLMSLSSAAAQEAIWSYGDHPIFGQSAFITIGPTSVGVACLPDRGLAAPAAKLMVSPNLISKYSAQEGIYMLDFTGAPDNGSGLIKWNEAGYYQSIGSTCDVHFSTLKKAKTLNFYISKAGSNSSKALIAAIPLKGANSALKKLEAACPAIRKDIANHCGI